jgi:hypothetical protein
MEALLEVVEVSIHATRVKKDRLAKQDRDAVDVITLTSFLVLPGTLATWLVVTLVQAKTMTPSFEQSIFSTKVIS